MYQNSGSQYIRTTTEDQVASQYQELFKKFLRQLSQPSFT